MTAEVSPHQLASTIIKAPASTVFFELIKPLTFKWMSTVSSAGKDESSDLVSIAYADNTVQKIRRLEYSNLDLKVSWEVVESDPPAPTFSAVHTIQCQRLTDGGDECYLSWNTDFSSSCTAEVLEDSKWKKNDSFEQLEKFIGREAATKDDGGGGGSAPSPLSSHQFASKVIPAPPDAVFEIVKPLTFKFMKKVASAQQQEDSGVVKIAYVDNTVQTINEVERSEYDRKVTWEMVDSDPPAQTFSTVHTIVCHRITTTNESFVTWNTDFSSDCTLEVLHDSKWKKVEAFADLYDFFKK